MLSLWFAMLFAWNPPVQGQGLILGPDTVCVGDVSAYLVPLNSGISPLNFVLNNWFIPTTSNLNPNLPATDTARLNVNWTQAGTYLVLFAYQTANQPNKLFWDTLQVTVMPIPAPALLSSVSMGCRVPRILDNYNSGLLNYSKECMYVCRDQPILFYVDSVTAGSTYSWTTSPGTGTLLLHDGNNGDSVWVSWSATGFFAIEVWETNLGGCTGGYQQCVEVVPDPTALIAAAPDLNNPLAQSDTLYICNNQSMSFQSLSYSGSTQFPNLNYVWDFGDGSPLLTGYQYDAVNHTYGAAGLYPLSLVVVTDCGCQDTAWLWVRVHPEQAPGISCTGTVCAGSTSTYSTPFVCNNGSVPTPYSWYVQPAGAAVSLSPAQPNASNSVNIQWANGTVNPAFVYLEVDGNCVNACPYPAFATVPIVPVGADIQGPVLVCPLSANAYEINCVPNSTYSWWVSPASANGILLFAANTHQPHIQLNGNLNVTDFWLHVRFHNALLACGGEDSLHIFVKPAVSLNTLPDVVCVNQTVNVAASSPAADIQVWNENGVLLGSATGGAYNFTPATFNPALISPLPQRLTVTASGNGLFCNTASHSLLVKPLPPPPGGILDTNRCVCALTPLTYMASPAPGCHLSWSVLSNGTLSQVSPNQVQIQWGLTPPYSFVVYNIDDDMPPGCASAPDTVRLKPCMPDSLWIIGPTTVCYNDTSHHILGGNLSPYSSFEWTLSPIGPNGNVGSIMGDNQASGVDIQWNSPVNNVWLSVSAKICGMGGYGAGALVQITGIPTATLSPSLACAGELITLSTNVTGSSFGWDLGDGNVYLTPGPTLNYVYQQPGTYALTLTVEDVDNCPNAFLQQTFPLNVGVVPDVELQLSGNTNVCDTIDVWITAVVNNAAAFSGLSYSWNTGATTPSIHVVQTTASPFSCEVTGTNLLPAGLACSQSAMMDVGSFPPMFTITHQDSFPYSVQCPQAVFLFPDTSLSPCGDLAWAFGDGQGAFGGFAMGHSYQHPGLYTVAASYLTPDNGHICNPDTCLSDTLEQVIATGQVLIPAVPNFAAFDSCIMGSGYHSVFRNLSQIATGLSATYSWIVDGNSGGTGWLPNPALLTTGAHSVSLQITAAGISCTLSKNISIRHDSLRITAPALACEDVSFLFGLDPPPPADYCCFSWDFGDGSGSNVLPVHKSYSLANILAPSNPHAFDPILTINDYKGCTLSDTISVLVANSHIALKIEKDTVCYGHPSLVLVKIDTFLITDYYPPYTYSWQGVGATGSVQTASTQHGFYAGMPGMYQVRVTDSAGCYYNAAVNLLFKGMGEARIQGQTVYCDGDSLRLEVANPQSGQAYAWTVYDGNIPLTTFGGVKTVGSGFILQPVQPAPNATYYNVVLTVLDSLSGCTDSVLQLVEVYPYPPAPVLHAPNGLCLDNFPVELQITNYDSIYHYTWSHGQTGATTFAYIPNVYQVTASSLGHCPVKGNVLTVPAAADFSCLMTGCYELPCDSLGKTVSFLAPCMPAYCMSWLQTSPNFQVMADTCLNAATTLCNFPLQLNVQPGFSQYQLVVETIPGCKYVSDPIQLSMEQCEEPPCCEGNVAYLVKTHCDSLDANNQPVHYFELFVQYNDSSGPASLQLVPQGSGFLSNLNTTTLTTGNNLIKGYYTDTLTMDSVLCLVLFITNPKAEDSICHQVVCGPLPSCHPQLPECGWEVRVESITCLGQDHAGNWEYKMYLEVVNPQPYNLSFGLFSPQVGISSMTTTTLYPGGNAFSVDFTDTAPLSQFVCFQLTVWDSVAGFCMQEFCTPLPNCMDKWCYMALEGYEAQCIGNTPNPYDYHLSISFTPPMDGRLDVVSQMGLATLSPQPYYVSSGVPVSLTLHYADSLHLGYVCLKVVLSDTVELLNYCADSLCMDLPPCGIQKYQALKAYLHIAPNPNKGDFALQYMLNDWVDGLHIEIVDQFGKSCHSQPLEGIAGNLRLSMRQLASGVYYVSLKSHKEVLAQRKMVVSH